MEILAYTLGYLFIGTVIFGINNGMSEREDISVLFFWPLYSVLMIFIGIFCIPYSIGRYIGRKFKDV